MEAHLTSFIHPGRGALHLGRPRVSPRTSKTMAKAFLLHDYLATLPDGPPSLDNTSGIGGWGEMMNDRLGCCTCSTAGHMIQTWTAQAHNEVTVPDAAILAAYEAVGGYIPGNDSTDNGARITD